MNGGKKEEGKKRKEGRKIPRKEMAGRQAWKEGDQERG